MRQKRCISVPAVINNIHQSAVPAQKYLPEWRSRPTTPLHKTYLCNRHTFCHHKTELSFALIQLLIQNSRLSWLCALLPCLLYTWLGMWTESVSWKCIRWHSKSLVEINHIRVVQKSQLHTACPPQPEFYSSPYYKCVCKILLWLVTI